MALSYPPQDIIMGPGASAIHFKAFERKGRTGGSEKEDIFLYMPQAANIPSSVDWEGASKIGLLAAGAREAAANGITMESFYEGIKKAGVAAWNYGSFNLASYIVGKLGSQATGETLMGAIGQSVPNPYLTLLFRGVNLRTFEFNFRLFPHNTSERESIYNIIKAFRENSLPDGSAADIFFEYPPYFEIKYFYQGVENKYINKFKKCALVNVAVDYTGNGMWSVTRDGFPTDIGLSLRFMEEELVLRKDVQDGY